jgi:hypothetical protein
MEDARVRLRLGGRAGGGLLVTSQVDVVFLHLGDNDADISPPVLPEPPGFLALKGASLSALMSREFLEANVASSPCNAEQPGQNRKASSLKDEAVVSQNDLTDVGPVAKKARPSKNKPNKRQRRQRQVTTKATAIAPDAATGGPCGPLVVSANAPLSRSNTLTIVPDRSKARGICSGAKLILSLDRDSFYTLGLPATGGALSGRGRVSRAARSARHTVVVDLPATIRAKGMLSPERVGVIDAFVASGPGGLAIPRPPPASTSSNATCPSPSPLPPFASASLRTATVTTGRGRVPVALADALRAPPGASTAGDAGRWGEMLDAAQRVLTLRSLRSNATANVAGAAARTSWTRYVGVCSAALEASSTAAALRAVACGSAACAVVAALGYDAATVAWGTGGGRCRGDAAPGFGGDAAVVTVVFAPGQWVTFELRASCDL